MSLNILVVGGSRHIGYHSALKFLDAGATVTFLLRSPATFDNDEAIQTHVKSGKARLIQGDGLVVEDVRNVWAEASEETPVDALLISVGFTGTPKFHLTKGLLVSPNNIVAQCLLNFLCEMPKSSTLPKVIIVTASGVTPSSRAKVPFLLKPFYGYLIKQPLQDKLGAERVIHHCAGWDWHSAVDGEPAEDITGKGWVSREGLPVPGSLKDLAMIVRPPILTDGEETGVYRAGAGEVVGWSVSRKDVAHFIVDAVTNRWGEYGGRQVSIAY